MSRLLDELAADAWPPLEQQEVEGWRLRAAHGVTSRANSALRLSGDTLPLPEVERFYRERGLVPRVMATDDDVDEELAGRGWQASARGLVLAGPTPAGDAPDVELRTTPDHEWLTSWQRLDGRLSPGQVPTTSAQLARITAPAAYVSVRRGGRLVAVGRGVADRGWLGIFSMCVLAGHRRAGHARRMLHALGAWSGAPSTYLQVVEANVAARRLYADVGLVPVSGYRYRTPPSDPAASVGA